MIKNILPYFFLFFLMCSCSDLTIKGKSDNCIFFTLKKVNENKTYDFSAKNGLIDKTIEDITNGFYFLKTKNKKTLVYANKGTIINFKIDSSILFSDKTNKFLNKWTLKFSILKKLLKESNFQTTKKINLINNFINSSKENSKSTNNKDFVNLMHFYLDNFKYFSLMELYLDCNNKEELNKLLNTIKIDNPTFVKIPEFICWLNRYFSIKETLIAKKINFKQRVNSLKNNLVKELYAYKTIISSNIDENLYDNIELAIKISKNSYRIKQLKKLKNKAKNCSKGSIGYNFRYPTNKNKLISFNELKGKPFYILLWETNKKKVPKIVSKFYNKEQLNKSINFYSVCLNYDAYTWREFFKKHKYKGAAFITKNGKILKEYYSIKRVPKIIQFDKNGKIQNMNINLNDI